MKLLGILKYKGAYNSGHGTRFGIIINMNKSTCHLGIFLDLVDHTVKFKESKKSDKNLHFANKLNKYMDLIREQKKLRNVKVVFILIVLGVGHGNTSCNPGRDWLHFT